MSNHSTDRRKEDPSYPYYDPYPYYYPYSYFYPYYYPIDQSYLLAGHRVKALNRTEEGGAIIASTSIYLPAQGRHLVDKFDLLPYIVIVTYCDRL